MLHLLCDLWCSQAIRCIEVISLLMQQHLRGLVLAGLEAYLGLWQDYQTQQDSLLAFAGMYA